MAEYIDVGSTRVILLKKCGSSTLSHLLRPRAKRQTLPVRYILTIVRNPFARLVSGWADLVNHRDYPWAKTRWPQESDPQSFEEWSDHVLGISDDILDHHFASQVHGLRQIFDETETAQDTQLWIGQLEHLDRLLPHIAKYTGGRSLSPLRRRTSAHMPWGVYYPESLLERTRERFRRDLALWESLQSTGYCMTPLFQDYRATFEAMLADPLTGEGFSTFPAPAYS